MLVPLDYDDPHPDASEVLLLIEIADSGLKYDREVKAIAIRELLRKVEAV
ncbi:hypothetical protein WKK05_21360 [Nostoc sp. UHCC 0302]